MLDKFNTHLTGSVGLEAVKVEKISAGNEYYDLFPKFEDLHENELLDVLHHPDLKKYIDEVNNGGTSINFIHPKITEITMYIGNYGDVSAMYANEDSGLNDFEITRTWLQLKAVCRYYFSDIPPKEVYKVTLVRV